MRKLKMTRSQRLVRAYKQRFGHPVPAWAGKNASFTGSTKQFLAQIEGSLESGAPVPEWQQAAASPINEDRAQ